VHIGGAGTPAQRKARQRLGHSILDSVIPEVTALQSGLGARDRTRLGEYLDNVREIERRIERAEGHTSPEVASFELPAGVPESFEEHLALMYDLLAAPERTSPACSRSHVGARAGSGPHMARCAQPALDMLHHCATACCGAQRARCRNLSTSCSRSSSKLRTTRDERRLAARPFDHHMAARMADSKLPALIVRTARRAAARGIGLGDRHVASPDARRRQSAPEL
jgi:hypothetical protein